MHNHAGVYPWPELEGTSDDNEMTNPTFPQVRAIDALDPEDWAIPLILAAGVTTAQSKLLSCFCYKEAKLFC
jgi:hypothetical protein